MSPLGGRAFGVVLDLVVVAEVAVDEELKGGGETIGVVGTGAAAAAEGCGLTEIGLATKNETPRSSSLDSVCSASPS
jgi:hypothetical protein